MCVFLKKSGMYHININALVSTLLLLFFFGTYTVNKRLIYGRKEIDHKFLYFIKNTCVGIKNICVGIKNTCVGESSKMLLNWDFITNPLSGLPHISL